LIDTLNVLLDRDAALPLWREYQELIANEAPYIALYYPERLNAVRSRLRGVVFDVRGETTTAASWWIHPRARQASTVGSEGPSPVVGEGES
jgi:ABC-type transport system substrate-binding protein